MKIEIMAINSSRSEVVYSGVGFQSSLTARWAVFFDVLSIEYLYEPQSFRVGNAVHSPSFFLPSLGDDFRSLRSIVPSGLYIDVQFLPPNENQIQTAVAISRHTDCHLAIFYGADMTAGLEWWPVALEKPMPCFFSQCPFCGRYGLTSTSLEDGQRAQTGAVHSHACMEEYKIAERYDVFSHCSQDLVITPHSPALDIAYEAARSVQFDGPSMVHVATSKRAVQAVMNTKTYCSPDATEWIIANALRWAREDKQFMHFDGAPWWVQHRKDLAAGVSPCTCYSCRADRRREDEQKAVAAEPQTKLLQ